MNDIREVATVGSTLAVSNDDPRSYVLDRARSEVHLLLDNLSANPDTTISALTAANPARDLDADWLEEVCRISWPPDPSQAGTTQQAEQAALLIKVKDYLNSLAKPASGATIAFTLMVTQEHDPARSGLGTLIGADAAVTPSRSSLATEAYPDLETKAHAFRRWMKGLSIALALILAATCFLSWYVAIGNAALADLSAAEKGVAAARTRVTDAQSALVSPATAPGPGTSAAAPRARAAAGGAFTADYCRGRTSYDSAELMEACTALDESRATRARIAEGLDRWAWFWGDQDTARWTLMMLGTAVLPVLYGFLGAAASIVRTLSRKIRSSLLSPRDLQLSLQQLALGAVVGACIGLFIAGPDANGGTDLALLGPVALSSSAISFVAGFGVEAVFNALEALIGRIFNVAPPAAVAAPSVVVADMSAGRRGAAGTRGEAAARKADGGREVHSPLP
jgi:hypothetical protein